MPYQSQDHLGRYNRSLRWLDGPVRIDRRSLGDRLNSIGDICRVRPKCLVMVVFNTDRSCRFAELVAGAISMGIGGYLVRVELWRWDLDPYTSRRE